MTLLDAIGIREGILIIITFWALLSLVLFVVRKYEDYQIMSLLAMEAQGVGVFVSESDRIKYQRKLPLSKPYTPIEGVRYIPHWYLKDPLPRNVKPKGAVLVDVIDHPPELTTPVLGTPTSGFRLIGEEVEERGNLLIRTKKWKTVEIESHGKTFNVISDGGRHHLEMAKS